MSTVNISIKMDKDLKDKAQSVFDALGLDMSTAINMILRNAIYQNEPPKKNRHAAFGCLKGKINVPDDFNEPLEDFKEYM